MAGANWYRGELTINGVVHLRARDYDAHSGTFTKRDPIDGDDGMPTVANPYHYTWNDPVDLSDAFGLHPTTDRGVGGGGGGGGVPPPPPPPSSPDTSPVASTGPFGTPDIPLAEIAKWLQVIGINLSPLGQIQGFLNDCHVYFGTSIGECNPGKIFSDKFKAQLDEYDKQAEDLQSYSMGDKWHEVTKDETYAKVSKRLTQIGGKMVGAKSALSDAKTCYDKVRAAYDEDKKAAHDEMIRQCAELAFGKLTDWYFDYVGLGFIYTPIMATFQDMFHWASNQFNILADAIGCSCTPPSYVLDKMKKAK